MPDAFLRRCFFHYIRFPDDETMRAIVEAHYPGVKTRLVNEALKIFYDMRKVPGLKKKPSTSELLDWLKLLLTDDIDPETLKQRDPTKLIPPTRRRAAQKRSRRHAVRAPGVPGAAGATRRCELMRTSLFALIATSVCGIRAARRRGTRNRDG